MRTTVVIDSDVSGEIERLRKYRTSRIGLKVDVKNVADVLDLLDDDR